MSGRAADHTLAKVLAALVAVAAVGLVGPVVEARPANLVINGSFEEPDVVFGGFAIFSNPSVPGWTHERAPHAVSSAGLEIQDHMPGGGAPDATAGAQFAELDSDGPSRIHQDVATHPGSTYRLTFLYSARPNTAAVQNHFSVSAGAASAEIGPLTSSSTSVWVTRTLDFAATGASSRIAFVDLGPEEATGGIGADIDLVSVDLVNSSPDCSGVAASQTALSPPDQQLHTITLSGGTDLDGGPVTLSVTDVTQDEPVGGKPDAATGEGSNEVRVRAERDGDGDGRVYVISYTGEDVDGGTCSGTVTVSVARKRGVAAVDSGASYDSFGA